MSGLELVPQPGLITLRGTTGGQARPPTEPHRIIGVPANSTTWPPSSPPTTQTWWPRSALRAPALRLLRGRDPAGRREYCTDPYSETTGQARRRARRGDWGPDREPAQL